VPGTFDRTPSIGFGELGGSQLDVWRYMFESETAESLRT